MPAQVRKLKTLEFSFGTPPVQFECQISNWAITNNTPDPEKLFVFCADDNGEVFEETDPSYALDITAYADWRSAGFSDFLWDNDGTDVNFTLVHNAGIANEEITWTGTCHIKAPTVGGEARTNEVTTVTLQIIGKPTKARTMDDSV
jgi:hypothetical protein